MTGAATQPARWTTVFGAVLVTALATLLVWPGSPVFLVAFSAILVALLLDGLADRLPSAIDQVRADPETSAGTPGRRASVRREDAGRRYHPVLRQGAGIVLTTHRRRHPATRRKTRP